MSLELRPLPATSQATRPAVEEAGSIIEQSLPPVEGKEAWTFLAGSFLVEMMCLGPAFSWSLFQNFLFRSPESPIKGSSTVTISAIGTLLLGMTYFASPLSRPLFNRYPNQARRVSVAALLIAVASLIAASFAKSAVAYIVLVGLIHGSCVGTVTTPYVMWLPQWFTKRRGLANGIAFAGAGTGGLWLPFLFTPCLDHLGFAWSLRVWAGMLLVGGGVGLCFVKPRLPVSKVNKSEREHTRKEVLTQEFGYMATPLWALNAGTTFTASAGLFAVSFYLATYCSSLGLSSAATSGAVSAFNTAGLLGEISIGYACDRWAYSLIVGIIGVTGTLSTFLLFGFAHTLPVVLIFTLLFGWAAGSFCATWAASCGDIARLRKVPIDSVILSQIFVRGVAALVGPLIAGSLYRPELAMKEGLFGSFGFGPLIEFTGSCMIAVAVLAGATSFVRGKAFKGLELIA